MLLFFYNHRHEVVQSVWINRIVALNRPTNQFLKKKSLLPFNILSTHSVEEPQFQGEDHSMGHLYVPVVLLDVLETFQMQS